MNLKVCAIDNSICSPGIIKALVTPEFDIIKKEYLSFTNVKKNEVSNEEGKIIHYKNEWFDSQFEKISYLNSLVLKWLGEISEYKYVAFEDYSFSSKGQVFSIAESTGLLKKSFFDGFSNIRLYSVPSIKMFFTDKGNADKVLMEEYYDKQDDKFNLNFLPKVYENVSNNPADNIVDAFAILKMLLTELKLRNNLIDTSILNEKKVSIFLEKKKPKKETKKRKKEEIPYCEKEFIFKTKGKFNENQ